MNIPPMQPRADEYPSLRDTFAAAALTGLLSQGDDGSFSEESYARAAFRWADAMLRERANNLETPDSSPTLTDAEREAVETAAREADAHQHSNRAVTLRGLLERMK